MTASPNLIVAMGASAGGLEPLETLFSTVSKDTGMAFVVIQHLSPDYKSLMNEILGRQTKMKINIAEDGMVVETNQVYLIPAKKEMVIEEGKLRLEDKVSNNQLSLPINKFFQSLAKDVGHKAVGIILSGSGSDGSRGVEAINAAGGLVLAQSVETAKFSSMPQSAIDTGYVDYILNVQDMYEVLVEYENNPITKLSTTQKEGYLTDEIDTIFAMLRETYKIDFNFYKPGTITRRIERRMNLKKYSNIERYLELLQKDDGELNALYKDLLIGVTSFFRDPEAFGAIEELVLTKLFNNPEEEIRVWVAGCATGEEAYSLAILFSEYMRKTNSNLNIKIFATDVHRESLNTAASGIYSNESLQNLPDEIVERWFEEVDVNRFIINKDIRRMIVFAEHDLLKDPPFTKIDLLTCRNLLIYMQSQAQQKIISLFHFALKKSGTLILGPSETLGSLEQDFKIIDKHWKIFSKRSDTKLPMHLRFPLASTIGATNIISARSQSGTIHIDQRLLRAYDSILEKYVSQGVLLNQYHELVHTFGNIQDILHPRSGRASLDVLSMAEGELKIAIASALQRAERERQPVKYKGVKLDSSESNRQVTVMVDPLVDRISDNLYFFLVITPEEHQSLSKPEKEDFEANLESNQRIIDLEQEVQNLRENLQATVEELETSNEELQASNEELVASNEELQSTNEELHSVNEELYTVNSEYETKIKELTETTNDLDNLLNNTEIGTVFLDDRFCIRKFTKPVTKLLNVLPHDIGRPIDHISNKIGKKDILSPLKHVYESGEIYEEEVVDREGAFYLMRVLPYIDDSRRIKGIVITFTDVNELRVATENSKQFAAVAENSLDAIFILDSENTIVNWNEGARRIYGWSEEEIVGKSYSALVAEPVVSDLGALINTVRNGKPLDLFETQRVDKSGNTLHVWLSMTLMKEYDESGKFISVIERDITNLRKSEKDRNRLTEKLHHSHKMKAIGTLAGGIAHEFNNFLQAIQLEMESLYDNKKLSTEDKSRLKDVGKMTIRAKELVEGILTFSHPSNRNHSILDLNGVVTDTFGLINKTIPKNIKIVQELSTEPLFMKGDRTQLQQILFNFISNSKDAIENEGIIRIKTQKLHIKDVFGEGKKQLSEGDYAILTIADNGMGMEDDKRNEIFDPFFTTKDVGEGTGLGLSIVYGIVKNHKGHIDCFSELGKGTSFTVFFPLHNDTESALQDEGSFEETSTDSLKGKTLLIVDDEPVICRSNKIFLQHQGVNVFTANSGEEALPLYKEQMDKIDLIVLDLNMPGMGGGKCLEEILLLNSEAKVLMVSGYLGSEYEMAPEKMGAAGFLRKPYDFASLTEKVLNIFHKQQ